jgi:hypothetical protein
VRCSATAAATASTNHENETIAWYQAAPQNTVYGWKPTETAKATDQAVDRPTSRPSHAAAAVSSRRCASRCRNEASAASSMPPMSTPAARFTGLKTPFWYSTA